MQKPLALTIAACLGFTGCQVFQKSATWDQAMKVRPGETARDPDPSHAYAAKLHSAFSESGVEHKVVVYQYRYTTRLREEAIGTRTAVVYRDDANPKYTWWLKDDRAIKPVWLPNGELDRQLSFYIRRKAEVLEQKDYPSAGGSGKMSVAFARSEPKLRVAEKPRPSAPTVKVVTARKSPASVAAHKPEPAPKTTKTPVVEKPAQKVALGKNPTPKPAIATAPKSVTRPTLPSPTFAAIGTPKPKVAKLDPIASRSSVTWAPPTTLDAKEQSDVAAPRDAQLEQLFRAKHGSDYNRFSPTDRRKMQQLRHGLTAAE